MFIEKSGTLVDLKYLKPKVEPDLKNSIAVSKLRPEPVTSKLNKNNPNSAGDWVGPAQVESITKALNWNKNN